jgi:hypothetical protein
MHPGRVGANRRESSLGRHQRPLHHDQLVRYALLDLVSKGIWLSNDQATPYLIDSRAWIMDIMLWRVTVKR